MSVEATPRVERPGAPDPTRSGAIELVEVTKRYGTTTALHDFSIDIAEQEFVVLLGPSGCGKSTVLKVIAGLEDATDGEIYIRGRLVNYVPPKARDVAMVFQNYALYPHMTVERNIGFPLKMTGAKKNDVRSRVEEAARLLGLDGELDKYPDQLSGGQRQRVALGRALVRDPVAFLMDEPLSNLDALLRVQMRDELLKLHRRLGRTMVYVTHDQVEAMTMADRIVVMKAGALQQVGTPREVYARPVNTFVASFVGSPQMNLFRGRVHSDEFVSGAFRMSVARDAPPAGDATLGIRPEDVVLAESGLSCSVTLVEQMGPDVYLHVSLPDRATCTVRAPADTNVRENDRVAVRFPPERVHIFDGDGVRVG